MKKKVLIFDMDGTLLDSMGMWKHIIKDLQKYKPIVNYLNPIDVSVKSMLRQGEELISDDFKEFEKKKLFSLLDKYFTEYYKTKNIAKYNVRNTLQNLHEQGYKMYIATATDFKYANIAVKSNGIEDYINKIYTPDIIKISKKNIEYFKYIIQDLNIDPKEVIYFDDVLYALKLSKEMGFETIAVSDEHAKNLELIKEVCDYYLEDFSEIINVILK